MSLEWAARPGAYTAHAFRRGDQTSLCATEHRTALFEATDGRRCQRCVELARVTVAPLGRQA